jgi:hypothetical protein
MYDIMDGSLDIEHVAETLPNFDKVLADPRLRPLGLVGGLSLLVVGALLQLPVFSTFWTTVVSGIFIFVGVPLFSVGLAAPEPAAQPEMLELGIELSADQRRIVGVGSMFLLLSPMIVAAVGPLVKFNDGLWMTASLFAVLGAVLIMTGFLAYTSKHLGEKTVAG